MVAGKAVAEKTRQERKAKKRTAEAAGLVADNQFKGPGKETPLDSVGLGEESAEDTKKRSHHHSMVLSSAFSFQSLGSSINAKR